MTTSTKPSFTELSPLVEPNMDARVFQEYLVNLTRGLRNVTLTWSLPRPSDLMPVDTWSGVLWVIIIPVIYFTAVACVLGFLLLLFWYLDTSRVLSASPSEVSMASAATDIFRHDTVVVNKPAVHSSGHSVVLNYLMNSPDVVTKFHNSETSKGSTRSLGVLTERDLQLPLHLATSRKCKRFTTESRRLSKSIDECSQDGRSPVGNTSRYKKSGELQMSSSSTNSSLTDIGTQASRNSGSFSTDSLEENLSRDNLRASMDAHRLVWMESGEIRPEDLYGSGGTTQTTDKNGKVTNFNDNMVPKNCNKPDVSNLVFADQLNFIDDVNGHFGKSVGKNHHNFRLNQEVRCGYKLVYEEANSQYFPIAEDRYIAGNARYLSTPQNCNYSQKDKTPIKSDEDGEDANSGPGMGKVCLYADHPPFSSSDLQNCLYQGLNYTESYFLQKYQTNEDTDLDESRSCDRFKNGEIYDLSITDDGDFNISSVSQMFVASEGSLEHASASSKCSGGGDSPANSLPSSIARFHASKLGPFPAPSAGYPLPCPNDGMLGETFDSNFSPVARDVDESRSIVITEKSSLSAIFGSCSQSPEIFCSAPLPPENSFDVSLDGRDHQDGTDRHDQKLSKLTKRPSPLSSFVNNIRQRYSFDENFLRCRRGISDDEEAMIRSPLIEQEHVTKHKRHQSLDNKRERITVEERLHEFGLLKITDKNKYFINPLPGKFEVGAGYYNYVCTKNDDVCGTERQEGNRTTPSRYSTTRDIHLNGHSAPRDKYQSCENILNEEKYQKFCQVPSNMEQTQNCEHFDDEFCSLKRPTTRGSDIRKQITGFHRGPNTRSFLPGNQVIEIHSGTSPEFDFFDLEENDMVMKNTEELNGCWIGFRNQKASNPCTQYEEGSFGSYQSSIQDTMMDKCQSHFHCQGEIASKNSFIMENIVPGNSASVSQDDVYPGCLCSGQAQNKSPLRSNKRTQMGYGRGLTRQHTSRALALFDNSFS